MKIQLASVTFGTDPEIFVENGHGAVIAPLALATEPKQQIRVNHAGSMNRDGLAIELNPEPSTLIYTVHKNICDLRDAIRSTLSSQNMWFRRKLGACLTDSEGEIPADAMFGGCDPDFNAYTADVNPSGIGENAMRFAGGHLHFGIGTGFTEDDVRQIVKHLDATVGIHSLRFGDEFSSQRRKHYGRAGDYRWRQDKGILEYRTPDAGWLWHDQYEGMAWLAKTAFSLYNVGFEYPAEHQKRIRELINA